ncbi:MAG: hypothetical protein E2586_01550 [Novosphingobium sp.]|uniref:hypothetical protein n=1 Tax=Novosphingobium sp. TaxID=1874826 RepID=UPI0012C62E5A|nr:hypothetical protein [Novosphingobium sp.]MPS67168.1 hypothetical protein [Novosphingobium sp.]
MNIAARLRREQRTSGVINLVLSAAFFLGVFGLENRPLRFAAPDNLALDFLPQAAAIALMSSLVPLLVVSGSLRRSGGRTGGGAFIVRTVLSVVLAGLASAALLAALCLFGPWREIGWLVALGMKLVYGTALGVAGTTFALTRLFAQGSEPA